MNHVTLGDVSTQVRGVSYDKSLVQKRPEAGYLALLRGGNIGEHGLKWDDLQYVPENIVRDEQRLRPGDVVIATSSGSINVVGKAAQFGSHSPTTFGAFCRVVRPNHFVDQRYFGHYFKTSAYRAQVSSLAEGANINNLRNEHLSKLSLKLPSLDEQRRIASILDKADELRTKRRQAIILLDRLARSIYDELFELESHVWPEVELRELCAVTSGITKGRKTTSETLTAYPYLAVSNVQDRSLSLDVVKQIEVTPQEAARYRLQRGDLLLTEGGDPDKLGRGTIWNDELAWCLHQNHVFRVRPTSNQVIPIFLSWYLSAPAAKSYFLRMAKQTTGIASINKSQLSATPVRLPPFEMQQTFAKRLGAVERLKETHQKHLTELDALFASLQSRAFKGEL
ncbi:restriction endonuclease subunit S [Paenarthrobacter sp. NPDC089714]|uniref:restriction endonuclease subunit S n=1 Tax=Paenarthrobacter sp. NPDC089714 TaxID=3364377 RepID=UPI00382B0C4F